MISLESGTQHQGADLVSLHIKCLLHLQRLFILNQQKIPGCLSPVAMKILFYIKINKFSKQ